MNSERLLAHFETISEAAGAVARLRRFILDLAVRGKLVEQDPEDEPAEELLGRISYEKARLAQAGEIKKPRQLPEIDEAPFLVPSNWTWCRIREATSDRAQKVPSERFTYIDVSAINKEAGLISEPTVLEPSEAPSRARKIVKKGDVVYSCVRPYLLNVAIVDLDFDPEPIASTAFAVLNGHELVLPRYLWIVLRSPFMVNCVEKSQRGQAYPAINDADFSLLPFPLPPLAEQHRIVAKVDELMALCDQLEAARQQREQQRERLVAASLQRLNQPSEDSASFRNDARFSLQVLPSLTTTPAQIKQLRQTILNLAVRGKLAEQEWSADERCQYLEAIKADQRKALRAKRIKPKVAALASLSDEMLIDNSSCTLILSLASVIVFGPQNGISPPEISDTSAPKALTLSATTSGVFDPNCFKHISLGVEACEPYWLSPGDLLFQRGNTREYVGMAAVYDGPGRSYVYPDLMIRVRISKQVSLRYVHMVLISPDLRAYLTSNATGSSETMPKINQEVLLNAPIPLPPLAEQHRIVAKVDELMALCDQLEQQLSQADQQRRRLLEAVLAEALKEPEPTLERMTA
jgi:type I restriction enzyme S subunit